MSSDRRDLDEEIEREIFSFDFFDGTRKIGAAQFGCDNIYFA